MSGEAGGDLAARSHDLQEGTAGTAGTAGSEGSDGSEGAAGAAGAVLEGLWESKWLYCPPNRQVYPWQWLWDSCFHAVSWCALNDQRGVAELRTLLGSVQLDGFLPHMTYHSDPGAARGLWGRPLWSTITQPPMYGHAIRVLAESGWPVDELIEPAERAMRFLFERRLEPNGLVRIVHPWESGADDNPRWGAWSGTPFERRRWMSVKLSLVSSLELGEAGSALTNPRFSVAAASFNALASFNAAELHAAGGPAWLGQAAESLAEAIDELLWDEGRGTWADLDLTSGDRACHGVLDALLAVLVTRSEERAERVFAAISGDGHLASPFGPCGTSREEAGFDPSGYGRGSVWPHLTYLFVLAARRRGRDVLGDELAMSSMRAMIRSGFAEHVDAVTGQGLGARPQGWATLPIAQPPHPPQELA